MRFARNHLIDELDCATAHADTDNQHVRQLLQWAGDDIGDASLLLRVMSIRSSAIMRHFDEVGGPYTDDITGLRARPDGHILHAQDDLHLENVLRCALAAYWGELWWAEGEVPTCVLGDPVGVVRTAYVWLRDLTRLQALFRERHRCV